MAEQMPDVAPNYFDASYSQWKGWEPEDFGRLSRNEAATYARELKPIIKSRTSPVSRVLEIGVGRGGFQRYCMDRGWMVQGTEIAANLVAAGQNRGYDIVHADELSTLPEASFDIIAGFDVLEHVPQDGIIPLLNMLRSKLATDGTILFRFPNADSWLGLRNFNGDVTHVTAIGREKMNYFARQSGFEMAAFKAEARLGFDGGWLRGLHSIFARPIVWAVSTFVQQIYFPRIEIILDSVNVVAHLSHAQGSNSYL